MTCCPTDKSVVSTDVWLPRCGKAAKGHGRRLACGYAPGQAPRTEQKDETRGVFGKAEQLEASVRTKINISSQTSDASSDMPRSDIKDKPKTRRNCPRRSPLQFCGGLEGKFFTER